MSKILAICWHPGSTSHLTAGGFVRFSEILKRVNTEFIVVDKYPNLYKNLQNKHVQTIEYELPGYKKVTLISSLIQRLLTIYKLIGVCNKLMSDITDIYVPFSELPQLTLVGVILKYKYKKTLTLCNLNVNTLFADRLINRVLHKHADNVITISKDLQKNLLSTGISANYINGVGFDMPKMPANVSKKYDFLFLGRHTKEKGIIDYIQIVNKVSAQLKCKFTSLTIGDALGLESLLHDNNIKILGNTSEETKANIISRSKILIFPSVQEGWGIVPMEALGRGIPVVAYDLPIYKESIGNNLAFSTVKKGDIDDYSKKVIDVLNRLSYYESCAKKWKPKFSWERISSNEVEIICKH